MTQQSHALDPGTSLDLEHHLSLETNEPRMGQIERDTDPRDAVGRAPLVTQPRVNAEASKAGCIELFAEPRDAVLEPRAFHAEVELAQANVEELFGR
jgi:hypothetical protein